MKNLINKIKKNKIVYIFLIFIVFMFPNAFYTKSEYQQRAILVSVAIDKKEDDYDINAMLVIPSSQGDINSNVEIVSGKGATVSEALHSITIDLGKRVSLAHCDTIFINKEILEKEDVSKVLDYFIRGVNATKNSMLIAVDGEGKEVLETIKKSNKINNFLASDLVNSENNLIGISNVSLKEFFKEYFTPGQISVMSLLTLEEEQNPTQSSGGGSGEQSGSSSGGESSGGSEQGSQNKNLKSENKLLVLKKGKSVGVFEKEKSDVFNLLNDNAKTDYFVINDLQIEDDGTIISNLGVEIVKKDIARIYTLKDNKPTLDLNVEIIVKLGEIIHEGDVSVNSINAVKTHVNEEVKKVISDYFHKGVNEIVELCKTQKADVFEFREKLNKFYHNQWVEYLNSLSTEEEYLNNIEVNLNLRIKSKF